MKVEILVGSNYPDGDEEVRVESGDVVDVPDKIAKSLIKNNAAVKFDSKKINKELSEFFVENSSYSYYNLV